MSTTSRSILHLGLDVHKESITIAVLPADAVAPTQSLKVPHDLKRLKRHLARLVQEAGGNVDLRCVYEASGTGFVLQRAILAWGYHCDICAPSLTPTRPGHRRKHDRYDAKQLAHFYRSGDLTLIAIPTEVEESRRDLVRCRTTFQRTLHRARQQVLKFCTRHGLRYVPDGPRTTSAAPRHWTKGHRAWLAQLLPSGTVAGADATVLGEYLAHMAYVEDRRDALDQELEQLALTPALAPAVQTLSAFRGLDTQGALVLATEIRDWRRFAKPTELMAYVGLVPREASTGDAERKGGITKAGNSHCRHVLVQAAHTYRHEPRVGRTLKARQAAVGSAAVIACSWKAQHRLSKVYRHVAARRGVNVAVVAVARELVGFLWATMAGPMAPAALGTSRPAA